MDTIAKCLYEVATDFENKKEDILKEVDTLVKKYPIYE